MGATTKSYESGEFLFREGDRPDCLYIVQKGAISIRKRRGEGQIELARIRGGEVIGEMGFFDRQPRSASAVAITKSEVLIISFDSLDKVYQQIPAYFRTMVAAMAERLRRADEAIRRLERKTVNDGRPPETDATLDDEVAAVLGAGTGTDEPEDPTGSGPGGAGGN